MTPRERILSTINCKTMDQTPVDIRCLQWCWGLRLVKQVTLERAKV
jgi:hypothetical protein